MRVYKKYLLRHNEGWFVGYIPTNRPVFSNSINHAKEFFDLAVVEKTQKRLKSQSKYTELMEFPTCQDI